MYHSQSTGLIFQQPCERDDHLLPVALALSLAVSRNATEGAYEMN